jgi:hypothetical protein
MTKQNIELSTDFEPSPHSVIIGRAKECKQHIGNVRLRILCSSFLPKYSNAINRSIKSKVVSEVVSTIRDACPVGAFVKRAGNSWKEVNESTAREKVGYVFRDLLSDRYQSSSKSKAAKRRENQQLYYKNISTHNNFDGYTRLHCYMNDEGSDMTSTSTFSDPHYSDYDSEECYSNESIYEIPKAIRSTFDIEECYSNKSSTGDASKKPIPLDPITCTGPLRRQSDFVWLDMMRSKLGEIDF